MTNGGGKGRFSRLTLLLLNLALLQPLCVLKRAAGLFQRVAESFRGLEVAPRLFQVHGGWLAEPPVARQSVLVLVGSGRGKGFWSKL